MPPIDVKSRVRTTVGATSPEDLAPLYHRFYAPLRRWTASRVGSVNEAEDIVQNVFLSLCNQGSMDRVKGDVGAYLFGVTRKLTARYFRQKRQRPNAARIELLEDFPAPAQSSEQSEPQIEQIIMLLERLAPKAREALRLRYISGMRPQEAARHAGCSENTFYQRVHSAIETLRIHVERQALSWERPGGDRT